MTPIPVFKPSRRRLICVIIMAVVLVGCAFASVFLPAYWYMIADAMPQSLNGPSTIIRSSMASLGNLGSSQDGDVTDASVAVHSPPVTAEVRDPLKEQIRQETLRTGHGVAASEHWRQRHPQDISDDAIREEQYLLNRETMEQLADKDGYIMVTWANNHYFDFVSNWVYHVEELGISSYAVGAMDNLILGQLLRAGIPCFAMQSGLTPEDFGWGSTQFHAMGRKKIKLVQLFTEMNLTVIITDVDTVWMRNPFEYFKRYPEADVLTSSDFVSWTHGDEGLENPAVAGAAYNIGIMMFSPKSATFATEWMEVIEQDDKIWDQNAFNDLARRGMQYPDAESPLGKKRLFLGDNGNLVMGILPVSIFANGHTFFVSRMHERLGLAPYVVHATFQFSGTPGKRNRLRERLLWRDPPAYFDPGHGWVTWEMDVPDALRAAAAPKAPTMECCEQQQGHFDLVNHQLLQVRSGLAIASVLGLGVVIPQIIAGQDRYWAPHSGVLPGSRTDLPYRAPLDHILDLEAHLGHSKPADAFGPDIPFREYSFLSNPALPPAVRDSQVAVHVCEEPQPHCSDGSGAAVEHEGALWVMPGLDDEQLRGALGPAAQRYAVLRFSAVARVFSRHRSEADHARFVNRTTPMISLWCCVRPAPGMPGHVWYDMWWDTVPHRDRHGREWAEPWSIQLGP